MTLRWISLDPAKIVSARENRNEYRRLSVVATARDQPLGPHDVHAELAQSLVPLGPLQLAHRRLGSGVSPAQQLGHGAEPVPADQHQPDVALGQPLAQDGSPALPCALT